MNRKNTEFIALANLHDCKACWDCVNVCPKNVLGKVAVLWHKHAVVRNADACIGCKKCLKACCRGVIVATDSKK